MKKYIALLSLMPFFANSCENCIQDLIDKAYEVKEDMQFDISQSDKMKIYQLGLMTGYLHSANTVRINHMDIRMEAIEQLIYSVDEASLLIYD